MTAGDRSVSDILQDIVRNVQEIVKSEVRLVQRELRDEASNAKSASLLLAFGGLSAIFALLFLLLMGLFLLSTIMPPWEAALIISAAMAAIAAATLSAGRRRWKQVPSIPERIKDHVKEIVSWAPQQTK